MKRESCCRRRCNSQLSLAASSDGQWLEVGEFTLENFTPTLYAAQEPQVLDLDGIVNARYVRLEVKSAYPLIGGDRLAYAIVGEVAASVPSVVPEPTTFVLGALVLLVFLPVQISFRMDSTVRHFNATFTRRALDSW